MEFIWRWLWTLVIGNPLVLRIVHGASRRQRHFWIRLSYLLVLVLLVVFNLMFGGVAGSHSLTEIAKAGTNVFGIISYGQVALVCLLAPLFMSGAISAEQSGKTFDILLTTPMSNLQIVLGSLLGRLFFVWSLLLSGLPLFSVLLVFGGVPVSSVFVSFGVAAMAALAVGSVAVALSVTRRGGRKAIFIFIVAIAAYLIGFYLLDVGFLRGSVTPPNASISTPGVALLPGGPGEPGRTTWLTPLHPLLVLEASINAANYRPPAPEVVAGHAWPLRIYFAQPFVAFMLLSLLVSGVLVALSAVFVRTFGQGEATLYFNSLFKRAKKSQAAQPPGEPLVTDAPRKHGARAARTVWSNPVAWREANTRGGGNVGLLGRSIFVVLGLGAAAYSLYLLHTQALDRSNQLIMDGERFLATLQNLIWVELSIITLIAIYMSAGAVSKEREDGTLDLILTTPITPRAYVWGKLRGLVSFLSVMLAVPVLTVGMVSLYATIGESYGWKTAMLSRPGVVSRVAPLVYPETWLLVGLIIVPFIASCVMLGMFHSIRARSVMGAIAWSVGVLIAVVGLLGSCGSVSAANIPLFGAVFNSLSPTSGILAAIDPWDGRVNKFAEEVDAGRATLVFGAFASAAIYTLAVSGVLQWIVADFDRTVRKTSGQSS